MSQSEVVSVIPAEVEGYIKAVQENGTPEAQIKLQRLLTLLVRLAEVSSQPSTPSLPLENSQAVENISAPTVDVDTSLDEEAVPKEREVFIQTMADDVRFIRTAGKMPDFYGGVRYVLGVANSIEYTSQFVVRRLSDKKDASNPFISDMDARTSHLSFESMSQYLTYTDSFGQSRMRKRNSGEVTLRYLLSEDNTEKRFTFVLSLTHDTHPFDSRYHFLPSFITFDLSPTQSHLLIAELQKKPDYILDFLRVLLSHNPSFLDSFSETKYIIFATQPGLSAFQIRPDVPKGPTEQYVFSSNDYVGNFSVLDGKNLQPARLPDFSLENASVHYNRQQAESLYQEWMSVSQETKNAISAARNVRELKMVLRSNRGDYTTRILKSLSSVFEAVFRDKTAISEAITILPDECNLRETVSKTLQRLIDLYKVVESPTIEPTQILEAIQEMESITDTVLHPLVFIEISTDGFSSSVKKWMKADPITLVTALVNQDQNFKIHYFLDDKFKLSQKLYTYYSQKWSLYPPNISEKIQHWLMMRKIQKLLATEAGQLLQKRL